MSVPKPSAFKTVAQKVPIGYWTWFNGFGLSKVSRVVVTECGKYVNIYSTSSKEKLCVPLNEKVHVVKCLRDYII